MSLFLRKECQTLLDDVGLQNYHIQIDEESKSLQIVGECGQVLTTIVGIRLSRMAPNIGEIKLAMELFEAFLVKHAGTFKEFISAKSEADKESIPTKIELLNAEVSKQNYQEFWTLKFNMLSRKDCNVTVKSNGECDIPSHKVDFTVNTQQEILATMHDEEWLIVIKWVKACVKFTAATKRKEELLAKLSSCEI